LGDSNAIDLIVQQKYKQRSSAAESLDNRLSQVKLDKCVHQPLCDHDYVSEKKDPEVLRIRVVDLNMVMPCNQIVYEDSHKPSHQIGLERTHLVLIRVQESQGVDYRCEDHQDIGEVLLSYFLAYYVEDKLLVLRVVRLQVNASSQLLGHLHLQLHQLSLFIESFLAYYKRS